MNPSESAATLADLDYLPGHAASTRLVEAPAIAARLGVARVSIKAEWERPLGNFKSLGGMLAGLRALARHCGAPSIGAMLAGGAPARGLPRLVCASDGNHGLAVAAAARRAGAACSIYLPETASRVRIARIEAQGATVVPVRGTYDRAVDAAKDAASSPGTLLVPDTSSDPEDGVVRDVMAGYSRIAAELAGQFRAAGDWPTHAFLQAGVGGLAAAVAGGLEPWQPGACRWIVVEPDSAACVGRALAAGHPVHVEGALETTAEMLSCGLASASALAILRSVGASAMVVSEADLACAVGDLSALAGIASTPSGAAGLAGLRRMSSLDAHRRANGLGTSSRVLLLVTEGPAAAMERRR